MIQGRHTRSVLPAMAIISVLLLCETGLGIAQTGAAVRGRVIRLPGADPNIRVNLIQPGNPAVTTTVPAAPDGSFEFSNIRPGNYTVAVSAPVPTQPIIVGNQDLTGIEFTVPRMRTLQGRILIEGSATVVTSGQRLLFSIVYANGSAGISSQAQADGSFSVLMPEGEHRITLDNLAGYATKSIVFGSTDLLKEPLRLSATDTSRLEVTLARTPGPGSTAPVVFGDPLAAAPVTEPVLISQVQPEYTQQARDAFIQGTVKLRVIVRTDGTVGDTQLVQGLGLGLDEAAVAAVQQWRFRPGMKNGQPVATYIEILVNFKLASNPR